MSIAKRFIKRSGALMLALMLMVGMLLSASAKSFADVGSDHDYAEQIGILSDIGVIIGTGVDENGTPVFSPEMKVNREQMAMLLFRLMLNRADAGTVNSSPFTDLVGEIYNGAISWAHAAGYIVGTGAHTFNPKGGITLRDGMTMVVRALGYGSAAMDKGYPWTYIDMAIRLGLDKGLENVRYTDELTRGQVACLLYNALTAEYLVPVTSGPITFTRKSTILQEIYGYTISDSVLTATNDYAIEGAPVVRKGYVTFTDKSGKALTVSFAQTGLSGTPNQWLGHGVKLVYKEYGSNITVLGAFDKGRTETHDTATFAKDNAYVTIGGENYNIVTTVNDNLDTNINQIVVYAFGANKQLQKLESNAKLAELMGTSTITLLYDDKNSEIANRALVTTYKFGKLTIDGDGKINLAENKTEAELTGGFNNAAGAVSGNYVLYYYNPENKALTIAEVLVPTELAFVTELTATYAVIGGTKYTFGCVPAGVEPASIAAKLAAGAVVSVVAKDGMILEVIGMTVPTVDSTYLVAVTGTVPVYVDGNVYYALTANIDGSNTSILTTRSDITPNMVYRYVKNNAGIYTLIEYSNENFTQSGEKKEMLENRSRNDVVLRMSNGSFTLNRVRFVTDSKSVIVVKNGNTFSIKVGKFTSDITVAKGAKAYAAFKDEVGEVETLKFLFVTDGSLGEVDSTTTYVRVIAKVGSVYENNTVYSLYSVFNLGTGKVENRKSVETTLEAGKDYALGANGLVLGITGEPASKGRINGYTAETVTIGNKVYNLTSETVVVKLNMANGELTKVSVASLHNTEVEFIASGNNVSLLFVTETPAE